MKTPLFAALLLCAALPATAKVTISYPSNPSASISVVEMPIGVDSIVGQATLDLSAGPAEYVQSDGNNVITLSANNQRLARVYSAGPQENINVQIGPDGIAVTSGTPLMDGINTITLAVTPIEAEAGTLQTLAASDPEKAQMLYEQLVERYNKVLTDYIASNPDSPAAAYALLNLEGDQFLSTLETLSPAAQTSILMPLVERQKKGVLAQKEAEARLAKMQDGTFSAPEFSLPDTTGKILTLADFRGKWVVLDFWGAWCRWCIKGFPELKETYKKYDGKFEVIGIDNRDSRERWLEAVAKYELPWTNVYNNTDTPEGMALLENYAIQGFPTKVIIDPQGIIRHITVGEDPEFYTALQQLLK